MYSTYLAKKSGHQQTDGFMCFPAADKTTKQTEQIKIIFCFLLTLFQHRNVNCCTVSFMDQRHFNLFGLLVERQCTSKASIRKQDRISQNMSPTNQLFV